MPHAGLHETQVPLTHATDVWQGAPPAPLQHGCPAAPHAGRATHEPAVQTGVGALQEVPTLEPMQLPLAPQ